MSFEGFYQILCKNGHLHLKDAMAVCFNDDWIEKFKCPICGETTAWWNLVDQTNGSYDENGNRIDGYIELEIKKVEICPCCRIAPIITYKIPKEK